MATSRQTVQVELLTELELNRNEAEVLVCLADAGEASSREVRDATGLSQPHVSAVTQRLQERGWVTYRVEKRPRAGRPRHLYRLAKPLDHILEDVRRAEEARYRRSQRVIRRLQGLHELRARRRGNRA